MDYLVHRFQTYFPHVDNVYSHRSTQRYKRRPFVSHYWDCRLKGRPPGTPKSEDPNKKKRKRTARERDLCDVKIKVTEYFPGAGIVNTTGGFEALPTELLPGVHTLFPVQGSQPFGVLTPGSNLPEDHPGANGARYFTIQRVNGNGANGKGEGVGGGHRHTLEDSDRVKKNSVVRHMLKEDKERKKAAVCLDEFVIFLSLGDIWSRLDGSPPNPRQSESLATSLSTIRRLPCFVSIQRASRVQICSSQANFLKFQAMAGHQKSYHTKATGEAAATALSHSAETNLKLYGSCFW